MKEYKIIGGEPIKEESTIIREEIAEICGTQIIKNETFIQGYNENGHPITIKFNTIELMEWVKIEELKKEAIEYIKEQ